MQGYKVRRIPDRGYLILAYFGPGYRISLQDLQLVMDVNPLRIDCMFLRGVQEEDACDAGDGCGANSSSSSTSVRSPAPIASCVLTVGVLDVNQPVRITEAEVVRVRKRSRGLLSTANPISKMFSGWMAGGRS